MKIVRISIITNKLHEMNLPITEEQYARWKRGALVQDVFPELTPDQREFILSGITPDEWAGAFPRGDNESEGNE